MQVIAASHLKKGDVAIAISHSGSSKDIVDALKSAGEHGAVTIAITNAGKSPIIRSSDIVLSTSSEETEYNILALNSRIVQLAIIDTLYFYVVFNRSEDAIESIQETEHALLRKNTEKPPEMQLFALPLKRSDARAAILGLFIKAAVYFCVFSS